MEAPRPARFDGALPLAAMLAVGLAVAPLHGVVYALAALYLTFAAAMASGGSDRPGEPQLPWSLYAIGAGGLAVTVPLSGLTPTLETAPYGPLLLMLVGFAAHVHAKGRHGFHRIGLLSAYGRRRHDARVGRTVEATLAVLVAAVLVDGTAGPALFAVAGWLLTAAAVAEREALTSPSSEPAGLPTSAVPVRAA